MIHDLLRNNSEFEKTLLLVILSINDESLPN